MYRLHVYNVICLTYSTCNEHTKVLLQLAVAIVASQI